MTNLYIDVLKLQGNNLTSFLQFLATFSDITNVGQTYQGCLDFINIDQGLPSNKISIILCMYYQLMFANVCKCNMQLMFLLDFHKENKKTII